MKKKNQKFHNYIINISDIKYQIKIKNKIIDREQRLIFFGRKNNLELMNSKYSNEFFIDIMLRLHLPSLGLMNYLRYVVYDSEKKPVILALVLT